MLETKCVSPTSWPIYCIEKVKNTMIMPPTSSKSLHTTKSQKHNNKKSKNYLNNFIIILYIFIQNETIISFVLLLLRILRSFSEINFNSVVFETTLSTTLTWKKNQLGKLTNSNLWKINLFFGQLGQVCGKVFHTSIVQIFELCVSIIGYSLQEIWGTLTKFKFS